MLQHNDGPFVPVQTRSERFRSTNVADFAPITGRELEWKYAPVSAFADLTGGALDGPLLNIVSMGDDAITRSWVGRDDARIGEAGTPEDRASANAWSSFTEALLIRVTGEAAASATVTRAGLGDQPRAGHVIIEAAPHSHGLVVLGGTGPARLTENVEIIVREGATLTVVSLQEWDDDAVHLASHFAKVERDANLKHVVVSLGGKIVRVNPSIALSGAGANIDAFGVYFADASQHLEHQVFVHHIAPRTRSRVTYKGALQGEGARTVWVGDVLIGNEAVGTDSYEQNRNLVLTEGTRADSVPNLEIETGEIAGAGHASATGRFDDEQLFYLMARGIREAEARRLVVLGFLTEIIQQIGSSELEAHLLEQIERELQGN
ncbi:MAG TPA: Fe-S cluster assembly protein SufD [Candidatus Lumbricidophila sp.]|nr:Fe-S cluster assembly protein SufD [Candidatus Lumbricidophila sp.]